MKKLFCSFLLGILFVACSDSSSTNVSYEEVDGNAIGVKKEKIPALAMQPAGFYSAFTWKSPKAEHGGLVRCSFDGSEPAPVLEPVESLDVVKTTVVRCYEFVGTDIVAKSTSTYFIDETIEMPVVSISVAPEYFLNYLSLPKCSPDPCYSASFWEEVEYPVHVEYFAEGSSSKEVAFDVDAGISIMGGWSRNQIKKSVSISMREMYQDGRIKFPIFSTRSENQKFKAFNLRNNGNRFVSDYIEDAMATSLLEGTSVDYQRSRQVVVFYDGEYYGIHDMREKLNEHFVETNYGIDSKEVDVIKHTNKDVSASGGSADGYIGVLAFAATNDLSGKDNDAYATLGSMLDLNSYADYMAAEIYYQNGDWPNNNVRAWHSANQPWKLMAFDIDHGFDWQWNVTGFSRKTNMFDWIRQGGNGDCRRSDDAMCFHNLFVNVIKNPDFKRLFINHAAVVYNSFVNSERVNAMVDKMVETLPIKEVNRDLGKFPRDDYWYKNSCGSGFEYNGKCLKKWAAGRDSVVRNEFRKEYELGEDISVKIGSKGNGFVRLDGMALPSTSYTGTFFAGNDMLLTAVPDGAGVFAKWSDGSKENPRLVSPEDGDSFVAEFK